MRAFEDATSGAGVAFPSGAPQGVVRIRKSKDRQQINQKKRDKRTNNHLQNITQKTKDRT
jgi:hypothetical protein